MTHEELTDAIDERGTEDSGFAIVMAVASAFSGASVIALLWLLSLSL